MGRRVLGVGGRSMLSRISLTIGLFWGALGFVIWISYIPASMSLLGTSAMWNLLLYVIAPALFFVFASIISAITDIQSDI